ncbi:hypothetical protein BB559_003937 [Furculomyces boomerangus]|uniref:NUP160 middle TPR domain-containing protein n=1 Tax=Furculomyces boomerangus TaxID=61424 RepID=A0A2T9YHY2_9FUNG|nr:hypothetical protein BB559_003937 [Furculomyces boomerangus]
MDNVQELRFFQKVPILFDNISPFKDPLETPHLFQHNAQKTQTNNPHIKYYFDSTKTKLYTDINRKLLLHDKSAVDLGPNLNNFESKLQQYKNHIETSTISGFWIPNNNNQLLKGYGLHWRLLNNKKSLQLRSFSFSKTSTPNNGNTNFDSISELNSELSSNEISTMITLETYEKIICEPQFSCFDSSRNAILNENDQSVQESFSIWLITSNGILYRIVLPTSCFTDTKNMNENSFIYSHRIKARSLIDKIQQKNVSSLSQGSLAPDQNQNIYYDICIKPINPSCIMVSCDNGLAIIFSGFDNLKIFEETHHFLESSKKSFVSQLYKGRSYPENKNNQFALELNINPNENQNKNFYFAAGLESNISFWISNPSSRSQKIEISLPEINGSSNHFLQEKINQKPFIKFIHNYDSIINGCFGIDENMENNSHIEKIALVIFVPDTNDGYFAIIEGSINMDKFENSTIELTSIKKISEIFGSAQAGSLQDICILENHENTNSEYFNWKIFTLWNNGENQTVYHGFIETKVTTLNSQSIINDISNLESAISWECQGFIGEKWIPSYQYSEFLKPNSNSGELELLNEWLVNKKNNPESEALSSTGMDQQLEMEIELEKLMNTIDTTMLNHLLNPLVYSSSIVRYSLGLYKQKYTSKIVSNDSTFFETSLRLQLISTVGQEIRNRKITNGESKAITLQNVYDEMYMLYTEWMWLVSICTQLQNKHTYGNKLFCDSSLGFVGINRDLGIDILLNSGDREWIINTIDSYNLSSSHGSNNQSEIHNTEKTMDNINALGVLIQSAPKNMLNPKYYKVVTSPEKNKTFLVFKILSGFVSRIGILTKAQLIKGFELRFKGGVYLDIEMEIGRLFKDVYLGSGGDMGPALGEMIGDICKLGSLDEAIELIVDLMLFDSHKFMGTYFNHKKEIVASETETFLSPKKNFQCSTSSIITNSIVLKILGNYSISVELLILLAALSFISTEFRISRNENRTLSGDQEDSYNQKSNNIYNKEQDGSEFLENQLLKAISVENKPKLISKAVESFRLFTFLRVYSSQTIFPAKNRQHSPISEIANCDTLDPRYYNSLSNRANGNYTGLSIEQPKKLNPSDFDRFTHHTLIQTKVLRSQELILKHRFDGILQSWTSKNIYDLALYESDYIYFTLFFESLSSVFNLESNLLLAGDTNNQIENLIPHPEKQIYPTANIMSDIAESLVSACLVEYIDPSQLLDLMSYLPTMFHVAYVTGIAYVQLGRFANAADCFASASSVFYVQTKNNENEKGLAQSNEKLTDCSLFSSYIGYLQKAKSWLSCLGIENADLVGYYIHIAKIFERAKSNETAAEFYELAIQKIDKSENNIPYSDSTIGLIYTRLFHVALDGKQMEKAYMSIIKNPDLDLKVECLRLFVNMCLDESKAEWCRLLISLPFPGLISDVERCIVFKTRNSRINKQYLFNSENVSNGQRINDSTPVNYYHVLFSFYMNWNNHTEAASVMYQYAIRLHGSYNPVNYGNPLHNSLKVYINWLDLQLQALLMSIQALEVSGNKLNSFVVRKHKLLKVSDTFKTKKQGEQTIGSNLTRDFRNRKRFSSFSFGHEDRTTNSDSKTESAYIVELSDVRYRYNLVQANKDLVLAYSSYLESLVSGKGSVTEKLHILNNTDTNTNVSFGVPLEDRPEFDISNFLVFVKDPYELTQKLFGMNKVKESVNYSIKMKLDPTHILSIITKATSNSFTNKYEQNIFIFSVTDSKSINSSTISKQDKTFTFGEIETLLKQTLELLEGNSKLNRTYKTKITQKPTNGLNNSIDLTGNSERVDETNTDTLDESINMDVDNEQTKNILFSDNIRNCSKDHLLRLFVVEKLLEARKDKLVDETNEGLSLRNNLKRSRERESTPLFCSFELPLWLTEPLIEKFSVDLVRTCLKNFAIFDASRYFQRFVKTKVNLLQMNTKPTKSSNGILMPYFVIQDLINKLECCSSQMTKTLELIRNGKKLKLDHLSKSANVATNGEVGKTDGGVSKGNSFIGEIREFDVAEKEYVYYNDLVRREVEEIDKLLNKYWTYVERESKELASIQD